MIAADEGLWKALDIALATVARLNQLLRKRFPELPMPISLNTNVNCPVNH
jgi:hypothetical protein